MVTTQTEGGEQVDEQAPLTVTPHRLDDKHILGFRTKFASAENDGVEFDFDEGLSMGMPFIAITAKFPDGVRVSETIGLRELLGAWADQVMKTKPGQNDGE